jgi:hypothetical protein
MRPAGCAATEGHFVDAAAVRRGEGLECCFQNRVHACLQTLRVPADQNGQYVLLLMLQVAPDMPTVDLY